MEPCQVQAIVHSKVPMRNLGEVSQNFGMGSEPSTMAGTRHTSFGNGFIRPFLLILTGLVPMIFLGSTPWCLCCFSFVFLEVPFVICNWCFLGLTIIFLLSFLHVSLLCSSTGFFHVTDGEFSLSWVHIQVYFCLVFNLVLVNFPSEWSLMACWNYITGFHNIVPQSFMYFLYIFAT